MNNIIAVLGALNISVMVLIILVLLGYIIEKQLHFEINEEDVMK